MRSLSQPPAPSPSSSSADLAIEQLFRELSDRLEALGNALPPDREIHSQYRGVVEIVTRLARVHYGVPPARWAAMPPDVTLAFGMIVDRIAVVDRGRRRTAKAALRALAAELVRRSGDAS